MSIYRHAAKVDLTQRALVKDLRDAGIEVYSIRQPCDLLLRFWCIRHREFCWQTLEVKSRPKLRKDQSRQSEFLERTSTPVAMTFSQAWIQLNQRHQLGAITV
jgi:hypothetical protein